jgi:hypothetical protein
LIRGSKRTGKRPRNLRVFLGNRGFPRFPPPKSWLCGNTLKLCDSGWAIWAAVWLESLKKAADAFAFALLAYERSIRFP